ncbi:16843_t:CDS:2, partial [Acaulospora colombiana]
MTCSLVSVIDPVAGVSKRQLNSQRLVPIWSIAWLENEETWGMKWRVKWQTSLSCHLRPFCAVMATISNPETLTKITAALGVFASSTDKQQIASANDWLQDFQHTIEAWETSTTLLINPDSPDALKTFAAQTLKSKVIYDLNQLPSTQLPLLRDTLVSALQQYSNGPRNILVQVCLALSALAVQMGDWAPTAVQNLIESLGTVPTSVP